MKYFLSLLTSIVVSTTLFVNSLEHADSVSQEPTAEIIPKIIGGKEAKEGMFPFMVAIYRFGSFICSGFIVSNTTVAGAAHCFYRNGKLEDPTFFHGIAGSVNHSRGGTTLYFKSIYPHPGYNPDNKGNVDPHLNHDLALLKTRDDILFTSNVKRICIAKTDKVNFNRPIAMGWGSTNPEGKSGYPDILRYTQLRILPSKFCPMIAFGDNSKICAMRKHTGLCHGDSGGPLVIFAEEPIAIGIASHIHTKNGCGIYLRLNVFTKIAFYNPFIKEHSENICEL